MSGKMLKNRASKIKMIGGVMEKWFMAANPRKNPNIKCVLNIILINIPLIVYGVLFTYERARLVNYFFIITNSRTNH